MNPATHPGAGPGNARTDNADDQQVMKAICYKCKYKTLEPPPSRSCPRCNFPLILQPQDQQSIKMNVREIFDRTSVEVGPKLPGLGKEGGGAAPGGLPGVSQPTAPRVQGHGPAPAPAPAPGMMPGPQPGMAGMPVDPAMASQAARKARVQRIIMAVAFASAIVLGVAAAVVQSAL